MVAGAAIRHCLSNGDIVIAAARQRLDIADSEAVKAFIGDVRPDSVINCAAFTDVDGAESNEKASYDANSLGVENLAAACREAGARFVTISTDYVFDGENPGFYTEEDKPNPISVYGRSKLEGEERAAAANPGSVIVRSGWIYGTGGTNFLSVMGRLLKDGKNFKAIGDQYGTPTYAPDLAMGLRDLAGADSTGIFHITNSGEGTSYYGFAQKVCEMGGFDSALVENVSVAELSRPAPRPVSSKMRSVRLQEMLTWETGISRHLGSI